MTIKEVEKELELPRATIRFYEKQKLLTPQREGNGRIFNWIFYAGFVDCDRNYIWITITFFGKKTSASCKKYSKSRNQYWYNLCSHIAIDCFFCISFVHAMVL